jgi:nicotinamidase-related amidase
MALSTLDAVSALIVIDLQIGVSKLPSVDPIAEVAERSAELARQFRAKNQPVFLVNAVSAPRPQGRTALGPMPPQPPEWSELLPELDAQPSDVRITKAQLGAFIGTALEVYLRRLGVTQLVLTGVATSLGVESTARQAYEFNYNIAFIVDAMTDLRAEAQANSLQRIFPMLGELGTCEEAAKLLPEHP